MDEETVSPAPSGRQSTAARPVREPDLANALPVMLARLRGLDDYSASKVLTAVQFAIKGGAPLDVIERDLLALLAAPSRQTDRGGRLKPHDSRLRRTVQTPVVGGAKVLYMPAQLWEPRVHKGEQAAREAAREAAVVILRAKQQAERGRKEGGNG
jgi:hypothetical protein